MAHYQITLAYDGTDFQGFQRQGNKRTVQGEVEAALSGLGWQGKAILAAGRTDRGVHATGQVIAFDLDWQHSGDALARAMNARLPADISSLQVCSTRPEFHPRYAARVRQYRYRIYCQPVRNPIQERFAWRVWPKPDLGLLRKSAQILVGMHDFSALGTPLRADGSTVRTIYRTAWYEEGNGLSFLVSANAFLYHMVRRMVKYQVQVGLGLATLEQLKDAIDHQSKLRPGLAPPNGLILEEVRFELSEQEESLLSGAEGWFEP